MGHWLHYDAYRNSPRRQQGRPLGRAVAVERMVVAAECEWDGWRRRMLESTVKVGKMMVTGFVREGTWDLRQAVWAVDADTDALTPCCC